MFTSSRRKGYRAKPGEVPKAGEIGGKENPSFGFINFLSDYFIDFLDI